MPAQPVSARTGLHTVSPSLGCPIAMVSAIRLPTGTASGPGNGPECLSDSTISSSGCSHNGQAYGKGETFATDACTTCRCLVSSCDPPWISHTCSPHLSASPQLPVAAAWCAECLEGGSPCPSPQALQTGRLQLIPKSSAFWSSIPTHTVGFLSSYTCPLACGPSVSPVVPGIHLLPHLASHPPISFLTLPLRKPLVPFLGSLHAGEFAGTWKRWFPEGREWQEMMGEGEGCLFSALGPRVAHIV